MARPKRIDALRAGFLNLYVRSRIQNEDESVTTKTTKQRPAAVQVTAARVKAATLLATPGIVRLLDKHEVCAITGVTYPTIWEWMRKDKFPRSREVGGRSMWVSTEIEAWLAALPVRPLKGDKPREAIGAEATDIA